MNAKLCSEEAATKRTQDSASCFSSFTWLVDYMCKIACHTNDAFIIKILIGTCREAKTSEIKKQKQK